MGGGTRSAPFYGVNEFQKTGERSARARSAAKTHWLKIVDNPKTFPF
jgi:hypothetical protein